MSADKQGHVGRWTVEYPHSIYNTTAETIPPYGLVRIYIAYRASADGKYYSVTKPSGPSGNFLLNGPIGVPPGQWGVARSASPAIAAFNGLGGIPPAGAEMGPHPTGASWLLSTSGKGYVVVGGGELGDPSTIQVSAKNSGTENNSDFPLVRIFNTTGNILPYGSVVRMLAVADSPPTLDYIKSFNSLVPTKGQPYAVTLTDAAADQWVDAAPVGVVDCKVYVDDATHEFAEVVNNTYGWLKSGTTGSARILWRERGLVLGPSSLGLQWARVLLGAATAGDSDDIRGIVDVAVTACHRPPSGVGDVIPGFGSAVLLVKPTDPGGNGATWKITDPQVSVTVENWTSREIKQYEPVLLRFSRLNTTGEKIYVVLERDEAGSGDSVTALIASPISPGTAKHPTTGRAELFEFRGDPSGDWTSLGENDILNPYGIYAKGSCTVVKSRAGWLIAGPPLTECSATVVSSVSCDPVDGIVYDTSSFSFVCLS